jgi:mono/diheme cytochrome c family protein
METRKSRSYIKTPDPVKDNLQRGDQLKGGILYNTYCASCHQRNGKGDNNLFPPLAGSEWVLGDVDRLIDIVLNGMEGPIEVSGRSYSGLMPHNRHLDDHSIASILTFIRTRFGNKAEPIHAPQVNKVRLANKK